MLIALFCSNCPGLVSQQRWQEDTRNKEARCSTLGRQRAGHISNFMPNQDQQHRAVVWAQKQTRRKCRGIERAQTHEWDCHRTSDKKLPFLRLSWLWGMGPADCECKANLHCSNRVLFSLGYKAYCDSRHVAMAAVGEGRREGGTDGGHQGPNSHARAPIALPLALGFRSSCVSSHYSTDVNPIQFNRSFWVPTMCGSFTSN